MSSRTNHSEDDLEYHINFPFPKSYERRASTDDINPSNKSDDSRESSKQSDLPLVNEENVKYLNDLNSQPSENIRKSEPVIFLLGWFNAKDRHLVKYSTLYNKLGYITFRYTAPSNVLFGAPRSGYKQIAKRLLDVMEETTLSHHPVIFHNFSNHGSSLYSHISQLMESPSQNPLQVIGCIYDSSPSSLSVRSVVKAVYRTSNGSFFSRLLVSSTVFLLMCFWKSLYIFSALITGHIPNIAPWCLIREPFRWPQLFLYSKIDDLVPYHEIEMFAAERETMGVKVSMHEFVDSPHVMHLKSNPQEYADVVDNFIKSCLQNKDVSDHKVKANKVS